MEDRQTTVSEAYEVNTIVLIIPRDIGYVKVY